MNSSVSRRVVSVILILSLLVPMTLVSSGIAQAASPAISFGDRVAVTYDGGGVAVRSCASTSCDPPYTRMGAGYEGEVTGGPQSNQGYRWWHIRWVTGHTGWTADASLGGIAYLQPLPGKGIYPSVRHDNLSYRVRVYGDVGSVNLAVRQAPGTGSSLITRKPPGSRGWTLSDNPVVTEQMVWWRIQWDDGVVGWSADSQAPYGVYLVKEGSKSLPSVGTVSVATYSATNIGQTQATLWGAITSFSNNPSADIRFRYRVQGTTTWRYTTWETRTSAASHSRPVTDLNAGTRYEFQAEGRGSVDTTIGRGSILTFQTPDQNVSARIDSYSPSTKTAVKAGTSFELKVTFTNTGDAGYFYPAVSIWDSPPGTPGRKEVIGRYGARTYLPRNSQTSYTWTTSLSEGGEYWLQFAIWNDSRTQLLAAAPSPSQNLIAIADLAYLIDQLTLDSVAVTVDGEPFRILTLKHEIDVFTKEVLPHTGPTKVYVDVNGRPVFDGESARKVGQIDLAREEAPELLAGLEKLETLRQHLTALETLDGQQKAILEVLKATLTVDAALEAAKQLIEVQIEVLRVQGEVIAILDVSNGEEVIGLLSSLRVELTSYKGFIETLDKSKLTVRLVQGLVPQAIAFVLRLIFDPLGGSKNDLRVELDQAITYYGKAAQVLEQNKEGVATYADAYSFRYSYLRGKPYSDNALYLSTKIFENHGKVLLGLGRDVLLSAATGGAWGLSVIAKPAWEQAKSLQWTLQICGSAVVGPMLASCRLAYQLSPAAAYTLRLADNRAERLELVQKHSACEDQARKQEEKVYNVFRSLPDTLASFLDRFTSGLTRLVDFILGSPGELQVYDSQGRVTGSVSGETREEIPNSLYDPETKAVWIFSPAEHDSHWGQVVGTDEGEYGVKMGSNDFGEALAFAVLDVQTRPGAVDRYIADWDGLAEGEAGIMIERDYDGDGEVDATILTGMPETPTSPSPVHNAMEVLLNTSLAWIGDGSDSVTYDIYFGASMNPPLVSRKQAETSYGPTLDFGTMYYWRVMAVNEHGVAAIGPLWGFTTTGYRLATSSSDGGSVTVPGEGSFGYDIGDTVDLVAEPEEGYRFVRWTGNVDAIGDVNAAETTITMNDHYSVTAEFVPEGVEPIWDWYDLDAIRDNLSGSYFLMTDLDSATAGYEELAGPAANDGKGWEPIGHYRGGAFVGHFDGQGHEMRNLYIDRPGYGDIGLFGYVDVGGVIEHVSLLNADVTGNSDVGTLAGHNSGTINGCDSAGTVSGDHRVGGLVGGNAGEVSNSHSYATVFGVSDVGGLAGGNDGAVSECYAAGIVDGDRWVGGLIGAITDQGSASNSYSSGSVTGTYRVGGLVGVSYGEVSNCSSDATVSGGLHVGGLIGGNGSGVDGTDDVFGGTVVDSHATSDVTGDTHVGGLVGANMHGSTVISSYSSGSVAGHDCVGGLVGWNNQSDVSNSWASSDVNGLDSVGGLVGWNDQGTVSNSYSDGSVSGDLGVGGLIGYNDQSTVSNSHYDHDGVLINGRHLLTIGALFADDFDQWLANDRFLDVNERLSEDNGCYVISSVADFRQLLAFGQDQSLKFRLENHLDLADDPDFYIPYLAGEFDGNGNKIANLSLDLDSGLHVGLFGYLASGGKVRQLGVEDASVTGGRGVGALTGVNCGGVVSECYSTGSVIGDGVVGGLVGANTGGTVGNCYSIATVHGTMDVGGLLGFNYQGTVRNCYAAGSVAGLYAAGGLVGSGDGIVSNSFWDVETSGLVDSAGGTGKTTAEMRSIATFTDIAIAASESACATAATLAGASSGQDEFVEAGTYLWEVPAGVTSITVQAWGAGGAGGGSTDADPSSARGGGGGGGGAYASSTLTVTPGQTLWVVVGAGGVGVSGGNGGAAGPSFVGPSTSPNQAHVRAAGGSGGTANTAGGSPPGGAGGTIANSVGQTRIAGDSGEPGGTDFTSCSGAGGRAANEGGYGGTQLCGELLTADGNLGDAPGGGGGGGRTSEEDGPRVGGNGAAGKVVISGQAAEVCATISPTTGQYSLISRADVTTTITWNDVSGITSIWDGMNYLTLNSDYTWSRANNTGTLTIMKNYLAGKLRAAGQTVVLAINFDDICTVPFTIAADGVQDEPWDIVVVPFGETDRAHTWNIVDARRYPFLSWERLPALRTWHVDDDLADYPDADFTTIQEAVDAANPGDTVVVYPGTYVENVSVRKDYLIIQSKSGPEATVVQAADPSDNVFTIAAHNAEIRGFTATGAYLGQAIYLTGDEGKILDNHCFGNFVGIVLLRSDNSIVSNNRASSNQATGIHLCSLSGATVLDNDCRYNHIGVWLSQTDSSTVSSNDCSENSWVGVLLSSWCNDNTLSKNHCSNNEYGIRIEGSSSNMIYLNSFVSNTANAYSDTLSNTWHSPDGLIYNYYGSIYTGHLGNFWADYKGVDADEDGIGDTPYIINGDRDDYPLMGPAENYYRRWLYGIPVDFTFDTDLGIGVDVPEVRYLQIVLNTDPDTQVAMVGDGSPGDEITVFDPRTAGAVIRFQTKHNVPVTGLVDAATREKLNERLGQSFTGDYKSQFGLLDKEQRMSTIWDHIAGFKDDYLPGSFPAELVMAFAAQVGGEYAHWNNEHVADDWGRGILQITSDFTTDGVYGFVGKGGVDSDSEDCIRASDRTNAKVYSSKYYANTTKGLEANIRDGLYALWFFYSGIDEESISPPLGYTKEEVMWMLTLHRYSGFGPDPWQYIRGIGDQLIRFADGQYGCFQGFDEEYARELGWKYKGLSTLEAVTLLSPVQLCVYDSHGNIAGPTDEVIKVEIPNSAYDMHTKTILILFPSSEHRYSVLGMAEGTYGLRAVFAGGGEPIFFTATGIPTTPGAVHVYHVDWDTLAQGERGVTVHVDSEGDGIFERTITAGNELTGEDFILKVGVIVILEPQTMNLQARGKWITAYVQLPEHYAAEDIDISTVQLLYEGSALDADSGDVQDGVLIVKFDWATVAGWFEGLHDEEVELTVAGEVDGIEFEGTATIRVIDPPRPPRRGR